MLAYAILGFVLGLPLFLGIAFRVSTSHLFFSLMAGELLGRYFGHEMELVLSSIFRLPQVARYAEVVVILIPVIATAVLLKGTINKSKLLLHFIPLAVTGVVLAAFVLPVLPSEAKIYVESLPIGKALLGVSNLVVGLVVILQLAALWVINKHNHRRKRKRKAKE